ncbi:PTS system mannose/fructose/N-acetylgalactosamine-transporter subunit IIB [Thermoanaerobacter siderophilus]|uniref:Phosphotransferase system, mannose/fructose/N-acetylgalactosamine-specific component IIB n=1 Tax=Thermoanaerobacter siderophilus SR4 TaxID=880478 RepID=I9KRN2_9THEO|nr:PTS sugar transporter subunit IIB [Thermoanaerobacter siderophilus]EIV99435.1 phosphotransferase system, mannose/fructose/N-acetylgalactosamine-specific component IIB [Thermoanaerobacter siderophilus SR4]
MSTIMLVRIDDRLIHGQVVTAWVKFTGANRIVIVDDGVTQDEFMINVLKMAAPPSVKIEIYNVEKASQVLKEGGDDKDRVIILAKTPTTIFSLINKGVEIKEVNIGGIGAAPGRKQFYKNISVSEEEKNILKEMINLGVSVYIQIVPDDKKISVDKLLNK